MVIDDHPMCREAAGMALKAIDPDIKIKVAGCLTDALMALQTGSPQIITLDLSLPDCKGFAGLLQLRTLAKDVPIVVVSGHDSPAIIARVQHIGAAGFVSKCEPIAIHIAAFRAVLSGKCWFPDMAFHESGKGKDKRDRLADLTPAQHRVLEAMGDGRLNKQLAHDLCLSEITIKAHIKEILRKLGVHNRTQAIILNQEARF